MTTEPYTPEWRSAVEDLVRAQADLLTWYRDVHEPAERAGTHGRLEAAFDAHVLTMEDARDRLFELPAPDWKGFLIKLQQHAWSTVIGTSDETEAAAQLLCRDVVRLAAKSGEELTLAPTRPYVGPDLTGLEEWQLPATAR